MLKNPKHIAAVGMIADGKSYQEVAEALGTTYTTIYRWRQKPEFQQALTDAKAKLAIGDKTIDEHQVELEAYRRGRLDGLVMQAINTLAGVMSTSTNDGAKVSAAKYVLEKFGESTVGSREDTSGIDELKSMLRVIGE
jgi:transposase